MSNRLSVAVLLLVFVLSGFAGLIYQSIWSHYLGLTLGHAAYAQTLVLAIFMGGMALGAWLVARYGQRLPKLILGYAVIEGVVGVMGLGFHTTFVSYTAFSQDVALPYFGDLGIAWVWQWGTAALLILPQTVLLGATFPLMSAGILRLRTENDGEILGGLYFTNSIGAAIGVLAATFVLLPAVGMPGAMMTAGIINVLVALMAWAISKQIESGGSATPVVAESMPDNAPSVPVMAVDPNEPAPTELNRWLLAATFLSSAASFTYEIGWVRMLNQALGSTIHSFELMLAAFIAGLAFGGLWVRWQSRRISNPVRYAAYVQVLMGIAALISIPLLTQSYSWVGYLMSALTRSSEGYQLYVLGTAAISLLIMAPAAFFAGMTLPLFTTALLRRGIGESAIGNIYAANTVGAIVGVLICVHVLIPAMGLRLAVTGAALLDVLIGLALLRLLSPRPTPGYVLAGVAGFAALLASVHYGQPDIRQQVSGVFRHGLVEIPAGSSVPYLRDGKTATISVIDHGKLGVISTNGKPDASLTNMDGEPTSDEITMIMAAALPLALSRAPERVAIIGWGSGLTTHTALGDPRVRLVRNIEIEPAMWEGAKWFGDRVSRAYQDPRSVVIFDDARTYFAAGRERYDVIISEPSNPWVSGVAALFTVEFYRFIERQLDDDGVFVQWIQSYEISDPLVATMLAALLEVYPNAELYLTNSSDLLLVASRGQARLEAGPLWNQEPLRAELTRVGLASITDLQMRRLAGPATLRSFVRLHQPKPHSDYFPTVALRAPVDRYRNQASKTFQQLKAIGLPVLDVLECASLPARADGGVLARVSLIALDLHYARLIMRAIQGDDLERQETLAVLGRETPHHVDLIYELIALQAGDMVGRARRYQVALSRFAEVTIGHLPAAEASELWKSAVIPSPTDIAGESELLAAYRAAAARDGAGMLRESQRALEAAEQIQQPVADHMRTLAVLGALAIGDNAKALELSEKYAAEPQFSSMHTDVRALLAAFAQGERACAAGPAPIATP